jgi:2-aminoadipate transaminase
MDATYLQRFLSDSARKATRSEIRELLKLMSRPQIISLAGGMPSPETFPVDELVRLMPALLEQYGTVALQYGPTEGDAGFRQALIEHLVEFEGRDFADLTVDHVLITSASQQALDLCARVFLSPGDAVLCGLPSYLGALGAFSACGARLSGIPLDDEGLRTDLVEQRLVDLRREGVRPKIIYTVPDFQNPSGVTLSLARRRELLSIAREFDVLVIEDSPYRQLRYVGEAQPCLASLDDDGRVISMFTFSKILFPGLRLGWVVADSEIISRLVVAKQPVDLCTGGLSQLVAREFLKAGRMEPQIERIRELYSLKREAMLRALDRHMDPAWNVRWTRPDGGLFLWLTLPESLDSGELLRRALDRNVAFVSGGAFHCDRSGHNTARLNFSYPSVEQLDLAVERLARCVESMLDEVPAETAVTAPEVPLPSPELLVDGEHTLNQLAWNLALAEVVE